MSQEPKKIVYKGRDFYAKEGYSYINNQPMNVQELNLNDKAEFYEQDNLSSYYSQFDYQAPRPPTNKQEKAWMGVL
jgi:hypothetical protein